jgi:hypothetical protein
VRRLGLASRESSMLAYDVADAELLVMQKTGGDPVKQKEWESKRTSAAKAVYEKIWEFFRAGGRVSAEDLFEWSSRWRASLEDAAPTPKARQVACQAHLSRMKDVRAHIAKWFAAGRVSVREDFATRYYVADAQIQDSRAKR